MTTSQRCNCELYNISTSLSCFVVSRTNEVARQNVFCGIESLFNSVRSGPPHTVPRDGPVWSPCRNTVRPTRVSYSVSILTELTCLRNYTQFLFSFSSASSNCLLLLMLLLLLMHLTVGGWRELLFDTIRQMATLCVSAVTPFCLQ